MINGHDFYVIVTAMVPLYIAMVLAYGSVRWWNIFTPDQCSGINSFVAIFAVPFLNFRLISMSNPYIMNFRFLAADSLQKLIMLVALGVWTKFTKTGRLEWMITMFSLSTLPNTLVIGIPLLSAMYGESSASLMVQLVFMQCVVWNTLLLFMFEFRAAKALIVERFPGSRGDIVEIKVGDDVVSLDEQDFLETDAEIGPDGKLHVTVRRSNASRRSIGFGSFSGMENYSVSSSAFQTPRGSNSNQRDFHSMVGFPGGRLSCFGPADDLYPVHSSRGPTPRQTNVEDDPDWISINMMTHFPGVYSETHSGVIKGEQVMLHLKSELEQNDDNMLVRSSSALTVANGGDSMLVRSSSAPIGGRALSKLYTTMDQQSSRPASVKEILMLVSDQRRVNSKPGGRDQVRIKPGVDSAFSDEGSGKEMSARVMGRLILLMVSRKLFRNPNIYASIIGLMWALVSFRCHVEMPKIIGNSISLISNAGLGMAMFSLGLFMGLQPKLIACGRSKTMLSIITKFLIGPVVSALAAFLVGLHDTLFHIAIVQAALPVGIVAFVFAKEYDVHATILSTSVIFGMVITMPVTIFYYIVLEH